MEEEPLIAREPAPEEPPRRTYRVPVILATVLLVCFALVDRRPPTQELCATERVWSRAELAQIDTVRTFIEMSHLTEEEALPEWITFSMDTFRVSGDISNAVDGMTAFALYTYVNETVHFQICWLMVVSMQDVLKMFPVPGNSTHIDAIKPLDSESFLVAGNDNDEEQGSTYIWYWKRDELITISGTLLVDSHDLQWSPFGYWVPTIKGFDLLKEGRVLRSYKTMVGDINHVQLLHNDTAALISDRSNSAVYYYNLLTEEVEWILKGLFRGQHNAEYFGDGIYVFDNNWGGDYSRLLTIQDGEIVWEYKLPGYSEVFGDNDRLPTGNVLATWWPKDINAATGPADVNIIEVTRAKEIAWEMSVGTGCDTNNCTRDYRKGWKIYSADRFYGTPLVYNVTCSNEVSFVTQNVHKENVYSEGRVILKGEHVFHWLPYWQPTSVTFHFPYTGSFTMIVINQFGQSTTVPLTCY